MAALGGSDFMKIWTQSDQVSERKIKQIMLAGLDTIVQAGGGILPRISEGPSISSPIVRWMEERGYPSKILGSLATLTLTFSGNLFGVAITAASIKKVVRVGTIFERGDGVQLKVTDITGLATTPWDCTVEAYGNTVASDDTAPVEYEIIAEVWTDSQDAENPRDLDRVFREVGTQIHAETFEILKTRENTKYEIVNNEALHQMASLLEKLKRQLHYSVLRSRPKYSGGSYVYGNKVEDPTMCGICTWPELLQAEEANPHVYVNAANQPITKTMLDDLAKWLWLDEHANLDSGDWAIAAHPTQAGYLHDMDIAYREMTKGDKSVGFSVQNFNSKVGKTFPILTDRYMRSNCALMVNLAGFEYGYYSNDKLDRKEIETKGRYRQWLLSFQTYGVVVRKPRPNIGMIYNLPNA